MSDETKAVAYDNFLDDVLDTVGLATGAYNAGRNGYIEDGITESRVPFSQEDYDYLRPGEAIPRSHSNIMKECYRIYRDHGMVKHVIDLMVDFTVSGINISHPNKSIQDFGRKWFSRVNGQQVSTEFALNLYLFGASIVDTYSTKLTVRQKRQLKDKVTADLDNFEFRRASGEVPTAYKFLNPASVMALGGSINQFIGCKPQYGIRLPLSMSRLLDEKELTPEQREILKTIPKETLEAIRQADGFHYYPLDRPLEVYHYRKLDWQTWADPILLSVYKDIRRLEKANLADLAALDAAINHLIVVKLGSLEHNVLPNKKAFEKLKAALSVNTASGQRILLWGPDIDIIETKTEIQKILDPKKYDNIMECIYGGLGIPPSMTGATAGGGTTNNLVSLKGFIERLMYGRELLIDFWKKQFSIFGTAMRISKPFELEFNIPNLGDAETEKKLLIELADRAIISDEFLREKFGANNNLETSRTIKEKRDRENGKLVPKASPLGHDPEKEQEAVIRLVEQGKLKLDELGVRSKETNKPLTQEQVLEIESGPEIDSDDNDNTNKDRKSVNGRPPGSKDSQKRKRNNNKPVIRASKFWAKSIQKDISKVINPIILKKLNKKNMRSLSAEEYKTAEYLTVGTLLNLSEGSSSKDDILNAFYSDYDNKTIGVYLDVVNKLQHELKRSLTAEEKRDLIAEFY